MTNNGRNLSVSPKKKVVRKKGMKAETVIRYLNNIDKENDNNKIQVKLKGTSGECVTPIAFAIASSAGVASGLIAGGIASAVVPVVAILGGVIGIGTLLNNKK